MCLLPFLSFPFLISLHGTSPLPQEKFNRLREARKEKGDDEVRTGMAKRIFDAIEEGDTELKGRFDGPEAFEKAWQEVKDDPAVTDATDSMKQRLRKAYGSSEGKDSK